MKTIGINYSVLKYDRSNIDRNGKYLNVMNKMPMLGCPLDKKKSLWIKPMEFTRDRNTIRFQDERSDTLFRVSAI